MSSCLKQQMARAMALWPHSQARWLPGYCGRPVVTWPALPLCAVAEPFLGSHLCPASDAAYCCALGNISLGRERSASLCPAEPALWRPPFLGQMCCCLSPLRGPWSTPTYAVGTSLSLACLA